MSTNRISPETLQYLAKQASAAFLEKGAALDAIIADQVRAHGLNQHQMRRVAEMANLSVHSTLYKSAQVSGGDRNITFEIARPERITAMTADKVASDESTPSFGEGWAPDYDRRPATDWKRSQLEPPTVKIASTMTPARQAEEHARERYDARQLSRTTSKLASIAKVSESRALAAEWQRDAAYDQLMKTASRYLKARVPFEHFQLALQAARPNTPEVPFVLSKLAEDLNSVGLLSEDDLAKAAAQSADPGLVSEALPAGIKVNGSNTVLKTLDTLVNASREAQHHRSNVDQLFPSQGIGVQAVETSLAKTGTWTEKTASELDGVPLTPEQQDYRRKMVPATVLGGGLGYLVRPGLVGAALGGASGALGAHMWHENEKRKDMRTALIASSMLDNSRRLQEQGQTAQLKTASVDKLSMLVGTAVGKASGTLSAMKHSGEVADRVVQARHAKFVENVAKRARGGSASAQRLNEALIAKARGANATPAQAALGQSVYSNQQRAGEVVRGTMKSKGKEGLKDLYSKRFQTPDAAPAVPAGKPAPAPVPVAAPAAAPAAAAPPPAAASTPPATGGAAAPAAEKKPWSRTKKGIVFGGGTLAVGGGAYGVHRFNKAPQPDQYEMPKAASSALELLSRGL